MSDQKGFAAIEMLIMTIIISIIAVIAIPRFVSFSNEQQLDFEAALLVSDLRYLQEIARTTNRQHMDFIHVKAESQPSITFNTTGYIILKNRSIIRQHTYPAGTTVSHTGLSPSTQFPAFGQNGNASAFTITMKLGKATRNVIVDTVGRVRVQ